MDYVYGSLLTLLIVGGGYLIYRIASREKRHSRMMENFGVIYQAGYEAGQRQKEDNDNGKE